MQHRVTHLRGRLNFAMSQTVTFIVDAFSAITKQFDSNSAQATLRGALFRRGTVVDVRTTRPLAQAGARRALPDDQAPSALGLPACACARQRHGGRTTAGEVQGGWGSITRRETRLAAPEEHKHSRTRSSGNRMD